MLLLRVKNKLIHEYLAVCFVFSPSLSSLWATIIFISYLSSLSFSLFLVLLYYLLYTHIHILNQKEKKEKKEKKGLLYYVSRSLRMIRCVALDDNVDIYLCIFLHLAFFSSLS